MYVLFFVQLLVFINLTIQFVLEQLPLEQLFVGR